MKVSVVIPAYNEEEYIENCLKSILSQTEKPDEIIVVDNNSSDNTIALVKKYPVKIITCKKQGVTPTRNKGFDEARYEIIARTDADTIVPKNWIKKIKEKFEADPQLVGYSGASIYTTKRMTRMLKFPTSLYFKSFRQVMGHDCLYGPNMAIRKNAWEKVRKHACKNDKIVHEDADLAIHLGQLPYGKLVFDFRFIVKVSERRWKSFTPYLEYPYRYIRTVQHHKQSLHGLKAGTDFVANTLPLPYPKRLLKGAKTTVKYAKSLYKSV